MTTNHQIEAKDLTPREGAGGINMVHIPSPIALILTALVATEHHPSTQPINPLQIIANKSTSDGWLNVNDRWSQATAQSMTPVMDLNSRGGGLSGAALGFVSQVVLEPRLKTFAKSIFASCGLTNR